jgi:polyisoprenoid-binding protein YceI
MSTATAVTPFAPGSYSADPVHSSFGFAVKHIVSTFRSSFGEVSASLTATEDGDVTIEGAARAESIAITQPEQFRAHVLSPEFFDAANHPEITFRSTDVAFDADGTVRVEGRFTVKDNTVDVVATGTYTDPVEGLMGETRGAIELEAVVDKNEVGLSWNAPLPKGGNVLADEVTLAIHIEFVQDRS